MPPESEVSDGVSQFRFSPGSNTAHLVRWREWGAPAFEEAVRANKPVAVFITAFWCAVCQRLDETTLSTEEVQLLLNAYFVPIRVEESRRPDVDLRYAQQGWPTIAFLTPHGEPILSVNALEPDQLISLLVRLVDAHQQDGAECAEPASPETPDAPRQPRMRALSPSTVDDVLQLLDGLADPRDGGFGGPHKYFHVDALAFYLHKGRLRHVDLTLRTLIDRAIYDPSDGGFFRYSSKSDWNEPHREKLLIDQANLLQVYLDTLQLTYNVDFESTAERLIAYLEHTLRLPNSPFLAGCQDFLRHPQSEGWTPLIDPLVYCDANAHAALAYFRAWRVLGREDCRERALEVVDALWRILRDETDGVHHYFDGATAHVPGLLVDSVALGSALLEAYASIGDENYLEHASLLASDIRRVHFNPDGGFYDIGRRGPAALRRPLTELTQNAAAAMFFLRLSELGKDARPRDAAEWALLGYGGRLDVYGAYAASFGHALDLYLAA